MSVVVIHVPAETDPYGIWVSGIDRVLVHQSHDDASRCAVYEVRRGTGMNQVRSLDVRECNA